eukprot:11163457-Alexandrium_andersonii.AAC.1
MAEGIEIERCVWITRIGSGAVCGVVGTFVEDFLVVGNHRDPDWMETRKRIKALYPWSPWKLGAMM